MLAGTPTAYAGSFQVNPIRVELSAKAGTTAVTVKNTGTEPVVVQTSVEAWSQEETKDVYAPTRELLVTPPVMTIAPDAERIVRVGLRRAPDRNRELSYRLFIQEVPPPPQPGFQGLVVALRVGLPVFVAPLQAAAVARVAWTGRRLPDNKVEIVATNEGTGHVQISEITVQGGSDQTIASSSGLVYVLPEQRRTWTLPLASPMDSPRIRLKAVTDAGNLESQIELRN